MDPTMMQQLSQITQFLYQNPEAVESFIKFIAIYKAIKIIAEATGDAALISDYLADCLQQITDWDY